MKNKQGFTLMELLIVIGIIAILAAAVIVAINPGKQFAQARNTTRENHLNTLYNSLITYQVENLGSFGDITAFLTEELTEICNTESGESCGERVNLSSIVPTFLSSIPVDPSIKDGAGTGYEIALINNQIFLKAKEAENRLIVRGLTDPVVKTLAAEINESDVTLSGNLISIGSEEQVNAYFQVDTEENFSTIVENNILDSKFLMASLELAVTSPPADPEPYQGVTSLQPLSSNGNFSHIIENVDTSTLHYFRAVIETENNIFYGEIKTFIQ